MQYSPKIGFLKSFLALFVAFFAFQASNAVKALPEVVEVTQPDGSQLQIRLVGDEKFHYTTSEDGFLLLQNSSGIYEYAVESATGAVVPSGVRAKSVGMRSAPEISMLSGMDGRKIIESFKKSPSLSPRYQVMKVDTRAGLESGRYTYSTSAFPVFGEPHSIVVLVEYQDIKFKVDNPRDFFNRMLNQEGFSEYDATGSVREYFIDNSMGQFKPTFDVFGPITLKNARRYYGSGDESRACEMVIEAVQDLDDSVNFRNYDHNNDGYVDSIYVIYAGYGEADGGPPESVWPYSWELESEGRRLQVDGVKINMYGCSNELDFRFKQPTGIGTFTHEFAHVMGLPDLYNTENFNDYSTPNNWSVLDQGNYNNNSHTPAAFSAFERYSLGWMMDFEIVNSGDYDLHNVTLSNKAYLMTSKEKKDEFYLLENRQKTGWDSYIPGHGMIVWHVDFVQRQWDDNTVNNNKRHQYVRLVRANNDYTGSAAYTGAPFPGTKNVTEFSFDSDPKLESWKNTPLNVTSISDITEDQEGVIHFHAVVEHEYNGSGIEDSFSVPDSIYIIGNSFHVEGEGSCSVFDLMGRTVGFVSSSSPLTVSPGIYIANGKKFMIK